MLEVLPITKRIIAMFSGKHNQQQAQIAPVDCLGYFHESVHQDTEEIKPYDYRIKAGFFADGKSKSVNWGVFATDQRAAADLAQAEIAEKFGIAPGAVLVTDVLYLARS